MPSLAESDPEPQLTSGGKVLPARGEVRALATFLTWTPGLLEGHRNVFPRVSSKLTDLHHGRLSANFTQYVQKWLCLGYFTSPRWREGPLPTSLNGQ